jgi:hypothetical protein
VHALLVKHWHDVEAVAQALLASPSRMLSGAEINALLKSRWFQIGSASILKSAESADLVFKSAATAVFKLAVTAVFKSARGAVFKSADSADLPRHHVELAGEWCGRAFGGQ